MAEVIVLILEQWVCDGSGKYSLPPLVVQMTFGASRRIHPQQINYIFYMTCKGFGIYNLQIHKLKNPQALWVKYSLRITVNWSGPLKVFFLHHIILKERQNAQGFQLFISNVLFLHKIKGFILAMWQLLWSVLFVQDMYCLYV